MRDSLESRKTKALVANFDMLCEAMEAVTPKERTMSANPDLEKVLDVLAYDLSVQEQRWFDNDTGEPHVEMVLAVLKTRLLPLLEAGQGMARNIGTAACGMYASEWRSALRAAMETKP